jgi:hypothetical protein
MEYVVIYPTSEVLHRFLYRRLLGSRQKTEAVSKSGGTKTEDLEMYMEYVYPMEI